jgi:hypothetical protein
MSVRLRAVLSAECIFVILNDGNFSIGSHVLGRTQFRVAEVRRIVGFGRRVLLSRELKVVTVIFICQSSGYVI